MRLIDIYNEYHKLSELQKQHVRQGITEQGKGSVVLREVQHKIIGLKNPDYESLNKVLLSCHYIKISSYGADTIGGLFYKSRVPVDKVFNIYQANEEDCFRRTLDTLGYTGKVKTQVLDSIYNFSSYYKSKQMRKEYYQEKHKREP